MDQQLGCAPDGAAVDDDCVTAAVGVAVGAAVGEAVGAAVGAQALPLGHSGHAVQLVPLRKNSPVHATQMSPSLMVHASPVAAVPATVPPFVQVHKLTARAVA